MHERRIYDVLMLAAGLMILLLAPGTADAACGGSSPNRVAASASRADVNDCVTVAISGDTITVPAGTATWSSAISLPATKDLTIIGSTVVTCSGSPVTCAAANQTNITCGGGQCFVINLGASHRISRFTMLLANNGGVGTTGNQALGKHFRIDHNRIVSNAGWAPMELSGGGNAVHPQGIVDSNILVDIAVHANGTNHQWDDPCSTCQHQLWAQQTPLGDSVALVYIEDNQFQHTSGNVNSADSNYAGRYVFRFNNTTSGRQTTEIHGVQGDNRGSQRTEVYHNSGSNPSGFSGMIFWRGGAGVAFGNRLQAGQAWNFGILFDIDRVEDAVGGGLCNGFSNWDQNTPGQSGWHCRDQVGVSHDNVQWSHSPPGAWNQATKPVYLWDNLTGSTPMEIDSQVGTTWIRANRDYYTEVSPFNGTSGVGVGPIANRPATCTLGVAYWATDEGEWNSRRPGPDGRLYKCTATNTWSLYYTPYPYPHPWTLQGGTTTTPDRPSGPQVN